MMLLFLSNTQQDSIPVKNIANHDTTRIIPDSISFVNNTQLKDSGTSSSNLFPSPKKTVFIITDTTSVCKRNSIADITFYDSTNIATRVDPFYKDIFPVVFTEKNRQIEAILKASLEKQLKPGSEIPKQPLHDDWIILIILIVLYLFSLVRKFSRNVWLGVTRFFLFRGINDPSSRDMGGLFQWESTLKNLVSFLTIGLFAYSAASYNNIIPSAITGIIFWLACVAIVILVVTLRHIICIITGSICGQKELFRDYLHGIYQHYRFSALFLFFIVILMSYTTIFPANSYFPEVIVVLGIFYMIRIIRLLIIFLNRNISIFYLILYLCTLEFLPVLISVKYISGLI
jgi:hypothetical protein